MDWAKTVSYTHLDVYKRQGLEGVQLGARLDTDLAAQVIWQVLQLGGAEALVPGVILPVAPYAVPTVVGGESLDLASRKTSSTPAV